MTCIKGHPIKDDHRDEQRAIAGAFVADKISVVDIMREWVVAKTADPESGFPVQDAGDMDTVADAVEKYGAAPLPDDEVTRLRDALDLCPDGHGHWNASCENDEND